MINHPFAADYAPGFRRNSGEVKTVGEFVCETLREHVEDKPISEWKIGPELEKRLSRIEALEDRMYGIHDHIGHLLSLVDKIVDLLRFKRATGP